MTADRRGLRDVVLWCTQYLIAMMEKAAFISRREPTDRHWLYLPRWAEASEAVAEIWLTKVVVWPAVHGTTPGGT